MFRSVFACFQEFWSGSAGTLIAMLCLHTGVLVVCLHKMCCFWCFRGCVFAMFCMWVTRLLVCC